MKRLLSLAISVAILTLVWSTLDRTAMVAALRNTDPTLLGLSLLWLIGLVGLSGLRLMLLARQSRYSLAPRTAMEATFVANALNMVLPGKMGDLLKALTLAKAGQGETARALSLGAWEKLMDLVMLFVVAAIASILLGGTSHLAILLALIGVAGMALALIPSLISLPAARLGNSGQRFATAWTGMITELRARLSGLAMITLLTALIWAGHLVQIALMVVALGGTGDTAFWAEILMRIPIAIVAGLIPLTFAGVGTRDAAIVVLFTPLLGAETSAALGVLFWLRYLVPGLLGLPLMPRYATQVRAHLRIRSGEHRK